MTLDGCNLSTRESNTFLQSSNDFCTLRKRRKKSLWRGNQCNSIFDRFTFLKRFSLTDSWFTDFWYVSAYRIVANRPRSYYSLFFCGSTIWNSWASPLHCPSSLKLHCIVGPLNNASQKKEYSSLHSAVVTRFCKPSFKSYDIQENSSKIL